MTRLITLTRADGSERKLDLNPAAISAIVEELQMVSGKDSIVYGAEVHIHGTLFEVKESREQILALLDALDAPGTAEVTEARLEVTKEVTDAAWTAWLADRGTMEDAIVAADRARGLRP